MHGELGGAAPAQVGDRALRDELPRPEAATLAAVVGLPERLAALAR